MVRTSPNTDTHSIYDLNLSNERSAAHSRDYGRTNGLTAALIKIIMAMMRYEIMMMMMKMTMAMATSSAQ